MLLLLVRFESNTLVHSLQPYHERNVVKPRAVLLHLFLGPIISLIDWKLNRPALSTDSPITNLLLLFFFGTNYCN